MAAYRKSRVHQAHSSSTAQRLSSIMSTGSLAVNPARPMELGNVHKGGLTRIQLEIHTDPKWPKMSEMATTDGRLKWNTSSWCTLDLIFYIVLKQKLTQITSGCNKFFTDRQISPSNLDALLTA